MKTIAFALLFVSQVVHGLCADALTTLMLDASKCADAWNREDYPAFVACLSDRIVADAATREAALVEIKNYFGYLENAGLKTLRVSVGEPKDVVRGAALQGAILPIVAELEGPDAKLTAPSSILGVSKDQGKSWKFAVLFKVSQPMLDRLYPEFQGKLVIPIPTPGSAKLEAKGPHRPSHLGP